MKPFDDLVSKAQKDPKHIILAEGEDPRVVDGAITAVKVGIASVTLVGREEIIKNLLQARNYVGEKIKIINPVTSKLRDEFTQELFNLRKAKGITKDEASELIILPQNFANLMVRQRYGDGSVAGAQLTTTEVVRSAIQIIGVNKRYSMISSFFIMMLCEKIHDMKGALIFADCGLVVAPDEGELAQIAIAAADSASDLLNLEPKVGLLSFSTKGSADHPLVDKVNRTADLIKNSRPDLNVDGDLQLDAALIPKVGSAKAPESDVAGHANVLIFPNLEAGNIGYKMAERIGKAKAIGPILQGLENPANDLSRGCDADAVYRMIVVTVVQAQSVKT